MMHYAQTTECRVRVLKEYFHEVTDKDSGRCDNCRDRPAHALKAAAPYESTPSPEPAAHAPNEPLVLGSAALLTPPPAPPDPLLALTSKAPSLQPEFSPGQKVTHKAFGKGHVESVEQENVTVVFETEGPKTVKSSYLMPLCAPEPSMPEP